MQRVPRQRCGSTKVSSSTIGWPRPVCQSAKSLFWHNDRMRETRFGKCQSGGIWKRLLLVSSFGRSCWWRKSHPIHLSRGEHLKAAAEKHRRAIHWSLKIATYHRVSLILGGVRPSNNAFAWTAENVVFEANGWVRRWLLIGSTLIHPGWNMIRLHVHHPVALVQDIL